MAITLASLVQPLSQQSVLGALLSALQGVGQVTQSGAGGAAAIGLGNLAVTGVPASAYSTIVLVTSGTVSTPGSQTTALSIQVSLDGGASWSGTQSSGGQSPWALSLTDYRTGTPTGLTLTFSDGPIPTSSWVLNESYVFPTLIPNYPLTDFASGSVQRTLVEADALVTSDWTGLIAAVTAGGFTTLASLPWLILLAQNLYNLTWRGPTSTLGQVIITDAASAGPFTIQQGQLWFAAISGNLYQISIANTVTLPKGGSILVEVQAQNPGSAYNDPAGSISTSLSSGALITSLPGVTVSNPLGINLGAVPWQASTAGYFNGSLIRPGNGYLYLVEPGGYMGTATSGAAQPTFPTTIGQTVVDNPGADQVTWTCYGVDGSASSYIQGTATVAAGLVYGGITSAPIPSPSAAANVVLQIASTTAANGLSGYLGQISIKISTDGGLTFGNATPLGPETGSPLYASVPTWIANTSYSHITPSKVVPVTLNGSWFKATSGTGNSGLTEPAWPTTTGATVVDGAITWTNQGPTYYVLAVNGGGSGGPNLGGTVEVVFQDSQVTPSFQVSDNYIFDTDWALQYGNAAETAAQLALRCQQRWGLLASATPTAQIEAWAEQASMEVVTAVASPDPSGTGAVSLYIAGASGGVSAAAVAAVSTYVTARLPIGSTLLNGIAISAQNAPITLHGTVYCPASQISAAQANLAQQLIVLGVNASIGNAAATAGTIYASQVSSLIQAAIGTTGHVDNFSLTVSAGGTVNGNGDLQLSAGFVSLFQSIASLTWVGI